MEELICGTAYRFFITSRNSLGDSPPSELSYTILTRPGVPHSPSCPFVSEVGLTFLRFQWDAPHDGGTAILGYRSVIL